MEEKLQKLKCECCGEEVLCLIQIKFAGDHLLIYNKGICENCFREGNFEEKMILKSEKFIQEQIQESEDRIKFWGEELEKIKQIKNEQTTN